MAIEASTVSDNAGGWDIVNGGVIQSFGDNYFAGNASNSGSLTAIGRQ